MDNNTQSRKHIVVVDDNPVNLDLVEGMLKSFYKMTKLISGEQLLKLLARVKPDLILLDIQMPGMDGYETLKRIKQMPDRKDIPVIFITGQRDVDSEREGFRLGAQDFITKPFDNDVALYRINSQLELYQYRTSLEEIITEKTRRIDDLQHIITVSWAEMVESRDGTTGSHVRNTTRYFQLLYEILSDLPEYAHDFPADALAPLTRASITHDIGKIGISDSILKKPAPLSAEEYEQMKAHSRIGANMIQKIINDTHPYDFLMYAKEMALYHHERWNGTGYPCHISGEDIPPYVRVLSIADVYDALTSVRPYKKAYSHQEALDIMIEDRGSFFCPYLFDIFLAHHNDLKEAMKFKEL